MYKTMAHIPSMLTPTSAQLADVCCLSLVIPSYKLVSDASSRLILKQGKLTPIFQTADWLYLSFSAQTSCHLPHKMRPFASTITLLVQTAPRLFDQEANKTSAHGVLDLVRFSSRRWHMHHVHYQLPHLAFVPSVAMITNNRVTKQIVSTIDPGQEKNCQDRSRLTQAYGSCGRAPQPSPSCCS